MYRQYEDPYKLQDMVKEQEEYCRDHPEDVEAAIELNSLRERERFAWADEYEED